MGSLVGSEVGSLVGSEVGSLVGSEVPDSSGACHKFSSPYIPPILSYPSESLLPS
ncbi:MAG: hypothetical protein ACI4JT_05125 [Oscillospiraceae bacterium]